jgi:hypothetical protein
MDAGHLIALQLVLLYVILGPLVLLAIYVLFDALSIPGGTEENKEDREVANGDPAFWDDEDINRHLSRT